MNWKIEAPNFVEKINPPKSFYLTEFNQVSVKILNDRINEALDLGQPIFSIYIESGGGEVSYLKAMLSIISSARKKGLQIATICCGEACSAAALIFCFGDEGLRFIGEYASIMIHGFQVGGTEGRAKEQKELFDEIVKQENEILQVISVHLKGGKNKEWIKKELAKRKDIDWYLNAQEAIDFGIANHIGIPVFSLTLVPEISIDL